MRVLLFVSVVLTASASAQTTTQVPAARQATSPIVVSPETGPPQIAAAHKIFLSNAGVDRLFPIPADNLDNTVSTALQAWGHYQLVSSPDEADLIFQLRGVSPINDVTGLTGPQTKPAIQLAFLDPTTKVILWTVTSPLNLAGYKKERARWKAVAVENLVTRVKMAAAQPVSSAELERLYLVPANHRLRNLLIVPVVVVVFAMVLILA